MTEGRPTGPIVERVPDGDNRTRLVCADCGYIAYSNPKVVVGAVCGWGDRILLCKRAIAPALGLWTIPAGYMELSETTAEGAAREVWEEAQARVVIEGLIGIYEIPKISQVNVIYRASMLGPEFAPGPESEAVDLFAWVDIPWGELAFPSDRWALERFRTGAGPHVYPEAVSEAEAPAAAAVPYARSSTRP